MGASGLMSIGARSMFASYAALQTTSHNIANSGVDGYSRQFVELNTAKGQFTGAGFFGKGADVKTVTRAADAFLTREAATTQAAAAMDKARADALSQLEQAFPTGENGLGHATSQMMGALVDLASRPQDISTREVVLARSRELAARFDLASRQIETSQSNTNADLRTAVETVNGLASRIAQANQQIALARGVDHAPNDLLDQRDQLIKELSQFVQVTTLPADDGTVGVFMAGGQRLVLSNQATELTVMSDSFDSTRSAIGIKEANGTRMLDSGILNGGSIAGLMRFQDEDLVEARNLIGQMARALTDRMNQQQRLGLDLRTPPQQGTNLFEGGAPRALGSVNNTPAVPAATVGLVIADASLVKASEYELAYDGTAWSLSKRNAPDWTPRTISAAEMDAGYEVEGLRIGPVSGSAATAGDRFLLQPVAFAAQGMRVTFQEPRGLAAASPLATTVANTNTGTGSIGALRVTSETVDTSISTEFSFSNEGGVLSYSWVQRDATTSAVVGQSASPTPWVAGTSIEMDGFELTLDGVPDAGDKFTVARTAYPAANNVNAMALAALRDEKVVGLELGQDGEPMLGESLVDAYASAMAQVGVRVQSTRTSAEISATVAASAEQAKAAKSGVNLDEEAAKLIQYQQSYQAAAKVLQVAQQVLDTLLQTVGR